MHTHIERHSHLACSNELHQVVPASPSKGALMESDVHHWYSKDNLATVFQVLGKFHMLRCFSKTTRQFLYNNPLPASTDAKTSRSKKTIFRVLWFTVSPQPQSDIVFFS